MHDFLAFLHAFLVKETHATRRYKCEKCECKFRGIAMHPMRPKAWPPSFTPLSPISQITGNSIAPAVTTGSGDFTWAAVTDKITLKG